MNDIRRRLSTSEVPVDGVGKLSRLSQTLLEKLDYQPGCQVEFSLRVFRYVALVSASNKNLLKHLQVFAFQVGGVDCGRHVVLLSVGARQCASIGSARSMATENGNLRSMADDSK